MKNIMYLFACLALILGCKPNVEKPSAQPSEALALKTLLEITCKSSSNRVQIPTISKFGIPLNTAKMYIDYYNRTTNLEKNLEKPLSFTINSMNFFETLDLHRGGHPMDCYIRAYIGLDSTNGKYHLLFTPVRDYNDTDYGWDVILEGPYGDHGANGPYMLNFSAPCPDACPKREQTVFRQDKSSY